MKKKTTEMARADALRFAILEHLGPASLTGGKMSVHDAFVLGWNAGKADIAQAVEPVAWRIRYGHQTVFHGHNAVGDYRVFDPMATSDPLFSAPQEAAASAWMPIESAPKDGSRVLICRSIDADGIPIGDAFGLFVHRAAWWCGDEAWIVYNSMVCEFPAFFEPTHWMPLPKSPGSAV